MKKTLTLAAMAFGLILTSAAAMAEDAVKPAVEPKQHHGEKHDGKRPDRFAKTDKNSDGFITKDEMMKAHQERTEKMFTKLDTDKDGKLSKVEMEAGRKEMREKWKARMDERKAQKGEAPVKAAE